METLRAQMHQSSVFRFSMEPVINKKKLVIPPLRQSRLYIIICWDSVLMVMNNEHTLMFSADGHDCRFTALGALMIPHGKLITGTFMTKWISYLMCNR